MLNVRANGKEDMSRACDFNKEISFFLGGSK
jgi:hypothetical protein